MGKKTGDFYFENFKSSIRVSYDAAVKLKEILENYESYDHILALDEMHAIENRGDSLHHELTNALVKAFITPIERNDILDLSQCIDEVTDIIEEILIQIRITNVKSIRPQALAFADMVIRCCESLCQLIDEFENFKKSKTIMDLIKNVDNTEEECDKMYLDVTHQLYVNETDPLLIMTWKEIYEHFEDCCDTCEHVAMIVKRIIIGNI